MSGFFAIFRREMLSLWVTPLAWVLLVVFLILQGTVFYSMVVHFSTIAELSVDFGPVQAYFGTWNCSFCFRVSPALIDNGPPINIGMCI